MITFYKKYWRTAFDIGLIVLTVYLIMLTFSYIYKIATPILLSFLIYAIIEPFAKFLNRRGIKKSIASAISILMFSLIIVGSFIGAGLIFTSQITGLINKLPDYARILQANFSINIDMIKQQIEGLPPDLTDKVEEYVKLITDKGSALAASFIAMLFHFLTSLSTFLINFAIGIILAYFLSVEINDWKKIAGDKTPKTFKTAFFFLKENVLKGIVGYLKAQFKLVSMTFIIIFIALLILRVDNAFSIALLSAVFDILPLLGVPVIFIPWIIYLFIVGNTTLAIWLLVLLGFVIIFRQILEPKITGDTLGVSAFTMLSFMIISLSLFGVAGMILSPILMILIKALYDHGYFHKWIHMPKEEFEPS